MTALSSIRVVPPGEDTCVICWEPQDQEAWPRMAQKWVESLHLRLSELERHSAFWTHRTVQGQFGHPVGLPCALKLLNQSGGAFCCPLCRADSFLPPLWLERNGNREWLWESLTGREGEQILLELAKVHDMRGLIEVRVHHELPLNIRLLANLLSPHTEENAEDLALLLEDLLSQGWTQEAKELLFEKEPILPVATVKKILKKLQEVDAHPFDGLEEMFRNMSWEKFSQLKLKMSLQYFLRIAD